MHQIIDPDSSISIVIVELPLPPPPPSPPPPPCSGKNFMDCAFVNFSDLLDRVHDLRSYFKGLKATNE